MSSPLTPTPSTCSKREQQQQGTVHFITAHPTSRQNGVLRLFHTRTVHQKCEQAAAAGKPGCVSDPANHATLLASSHGIDGYI
jgi:hypothetical protein